MIVSDNSDEKSPPRHPLAQPVQRREYNSALTMARKVPASPPVLAAARKIGPAGHAPEFDKLARRRLPCVLTPTARRGFHAATLKVGKNSIAQVPIGPYFIAVDICNFLAGVMRENGARVEVRL